MAVGTFDAPTPHEVDPDHMANVLISILTGLSQADTSGSSGLPTLGERSPFAATDTPTATTDTTTATSSGTTAPAVPEGSFVHPGPEEDMAVNSPFGPRGNDFHPGIDLAFPDHTSVLAATSGQITQAGGVTEGGYGVVEITAPNGLVTRYGHVSALNVAVGDTVQAGQVIASSGGAGEAGSGNADGPHLHFEVLVDGKNVDPAPFLAGGMSIAGQPETTTSEAGVTTANPLSPDQIVSGQLANVLDVIGGNTPTQDVRQSAQPTVDTTPGGGTPNAPGTPGNASGNWAEDILNAIGAPVTDENMRFMNAWIAMEGGANHNNPLNTTLDKEGASNWNDLGNNIHVKTYVSYEQGLEATVQTLLQGNMAGIVSRLRAGNDAMATAQALAESHWGTGDGVIRALGG